MPTPFPGMDPYLEGPTWPDFHATFIVNWREALLDRLPPTYDAGINERYSLVELSRSESEAVFLPDIAVTQEQNPGGSTSGSSAGVATLPEPVTLSLPQYEQVRETNIEIRRRSDRSLVAVLELLSPSNKHGDGREDYLAKRNAILRQSVHLVEVDLLLGGRRLPFRSQLPKGDYFAIVSRAAHRPQCHVYAWSLRDPLPAIPIPLDTPDADIQTDLGGVFAATYDRGRYNRRIKYQEPVPAPVNPSQRAWIEQRVVSRTGAAPHQ